jgi:hypothetical protein
MPLPDLKSCRSQGGVPGTETTGPYSLGPQRQLIGDLPGRLRSAGLHNQDPEQTFFNWLERSPA